MSILENIGISAICSVISVVIFIFGTSVGMDVYKNEAVELGYGEYFINEKGNKEFRWKKKE